MFGWEVNEWFLDPLCLESRLQACPCSASSRWEIWMEISRSQQTLWFFFKPRTVSEMVSPFWHPVKDSLSGEQRDLLSAQLISQCEPGQLNVLADGDSWVCPITTLVQQGYLFKIGFGLLFRRRETLLVFFPLLVPGKRQIKTQKSIARGLCVISWGFSKFPDALQRLLSFWTINCGLAVDVLGFIRIL